MTDFIDTRMDAIEGEVTAVEERDIVTDVSVSSECLAEVMKDLNLDSVGNCGPVDNEADKKKEEEEEPIPEGDPGMVDLEWDFFIKMKDQPNTVVASYLPELRRRYKVTERRSKATEVYGSLVDR
ncbi:hypothetical protein PRIPAC_87610 [Pristionchus pacificus]|nr:hypothetical protein PRIPAC_87610 [Pristionchus pacificus]